MRKYKLWSKELELTFWISKEECERGYLRSFSALKRDEKELKLEYNKNIY